LGAGAICEHKINKPRRCCASDQARFEFAVDIALVGQYGAACVGGVQYVLEMIGVVLACRADLELADQLVAEYGLLRFAVLAIKTAPQVVLHPS
jgi:hypothetical protein